MDNKKNMVTINFIDTDGATIKIQVPEGTNILEAAHSNGIALEGSCEGSLACSTCHVIVDAQTYQKLGGGDNICEEEEDMLDMAFGLTTTSRLGCQVQVTKDIEGATFTLPKSTRNTKV